MKGAAKNLIKEFIIGFGFLSGIWFSIGIDPQKAVMALVGKYIEPISLIVQIVFLILPLILMVLTARNIFRAYKKGGILGIIGVLIAFISGTLLIWNWIASIILLGIAMGLGILAFKKRQKR